ncbi:MAG: RNA polymerase sigma factor, partial [Eubacteriales bacterium]
MPKGVSLMQSPVAERLMAEYISDYMEKIFYFCLKKCGNTTSAEDLSSDISVNVIAALSKGTVPENFPAWVWQIARNRYAAFAGKRHEDSKRLVPLPQNDDGESFDLPDDISVEETYVEGEVSRENLARMRRALAFIRADYRNILVAYYIEDRKVEEIAAMLGMPKGTVTSKLFRSRKLLKEGMTMAREFGKRSYKPENIRFVMNGMDGKNGEPYSIVNRLIVKNLLLSAYEKPLTAEEIALDVGVALPYTQAELDDLVCNTLMKKVGDKYATRMFILSNEAQEKQAESLIRIAAPLTAKMIELLEYKIKCWEENGSRWHEGYQAYEDMKWALLMDTVDSIRHSDLCVAPAMEEDESLLDPNHRTLKRPNGGAWDLMGFETYSEKYPMPSFVGMHGCMDSPFMDSPFDENWINCWQYKFYYHNIQEQTPLHIKWEEAQALKAVVLGDISGVRTAVLEKLIGYGYLKKEKDTYLPMFYVHFQDKIGKFTESQQAEYNRIYGEICDILRNHYIYCRDLVLAEVPEAMRDEPHLVNFACTEFPMEIRGTVLEEALRTGWLTYNDEPDEGKKRAL